MDAQPTGDDRERFWRDYLTQRRLPRAPGPPDLPAPAERDPRCQLCAAPFAGATAPAHARDRQASGGQEPAGVRVVLHLHRASTTAVRRSRPASCSPTSAVRRPSPSTCPASAFHDSARPLLRRRRPAPCSSTTAASTSSSATRSSRCSSRSMSGPRHAARPSTAAEALLRAHRPRRSPTGRGCPSAQACIRVRAWVGAVGDEAHTGAHGAGRHRQHGGPPGVRGRRRRGPRQRSRSRRRRTWTRGSSGGPSALKGKEAPTEVVSLRVRS